MAENEKVENVDVRVEKQDAGWVVIADVDGERKQIGAAHPSEQEAQTYADHMGAGVDRFTGAAEESAPDPAKYPGDGDPTRN